MADEFPEPHSKHIGCSFHWKQSCRNKLKKLGVPAAVIKKLFGTDGLIDFLCVVTLEEVPAAIAYIRMKMEEGTDKPSFDHFWLLYFPKTWMRKTKHYMDKSGLYLFSSWNISHLIDDNGRVAKNEDGCDVMVNRTNNSLERFNRVLNEKIPIHPTMEVFVTVVKEISNDYVDLMNAIKKRKGKKYEHAPVNLPIIPSEFRRFQKSFQNEEKKEIEKKKKGRNS